MSKRELGVIRAGKTLAETLREILRESYRIDTEGFSDRILAEFVRSLDPDLNRKLAHDEAWFDSLLLEGEVIEEFNDVELRDVIVRMVVATIDRGDAIVIATGLAGGYELRAIVKDGRTGIVLIGDQHVIEGERVLREFGGLRVTGELYAI